MRATPRLIASVVAALLAVTVMVGFAAPAGAAFHDQPSTRWVPNGPVHAIAVHADRVYIGGAFTSLRNPDTGKTVQRNHLAALTDAGSLVRSWSPQADGDVRALAVSSDGSRVLAGGAFGTVDGTSRRRLVALTTDAGSVVSPWRGRASGVVRDLAVVGERVYVGGAFASLNGIRNRGVGVLDVDRGTRIDGFSTSTDGTVYGLAAAGKRLIVAGRFGTVNGTSRPALASVSLGTGALSTWAPPKLCVDCTKLWDVAVAGNRVYVGAGGPGGRMAAYDLTSGRVVWAIRGNGDVQAVAVADGMVYAGGHFRNDFGGVSRTQLAAVDADTGAIDSNFAPRMLSSFPGVWALAVSDSALYAGGHFTGVTRQNVSPYLARFARS